MNWVPNGAPRRGLGASKGRGENVGGPGSTPPIYKGTSRTMRALILAATAAIAIASTKPEGTWTCGSAVISGDLMGIAAVSATKAIVAGGVNPGPISPAGGFGP